eukprot:scaffold136982_cov20-Tisochrysis_lutea.AAC.1
MPAVSFHSGLLDIALAPGLAFASGAYTGPSASRWVLSAPLLPCPAQHPHLRIDSMTYGSTSAPLEVQQQQSSALSCAS